MSNKKILKVYYLLILKEYKEKNLKKNSAVHDRIIDIIKVIGKRGLSIRGKNNGAAY
jgi:hypothetical protein